MKYSEFQSLYGRSDPRSVLAFQEPYAEVLPHIVIQAEELSASLLLFDPKQDEAQRNKPFADIFIEAFDQGMWLVILDAASVDYVEWRHVGARLASVLPDARYRMRGHFRLFVFLHENQQLSHLAPPLLNQFAIVVDQFGNVHARSDVSPIFGGSSTVTNGGDFLALCPTSTEAKPGEREHDRSKPYAFFNDARSKALNFQGGRTAATDPEYVDEVLCSLRDELLQKQQYRVSEMENFIEEEFERVMREAKEAASYNDGNFAEATGTEHQKDPRVEHERIEAEVTKRYNEHFDWVYGNILEWVVEQCPDADINALPTIPNADITIDEVTWQTQEEVCNTGIWQGAEVSVKELRKSYVVDVNTTLNNLFMNEAARHFSLRHPQVLTVYGLSDGRMVMENCKGTLEQSLIRARYSNVRWTVRKFLQVMQQALQGLSYLATQVIHRDIACRSVIEVSEDCFKIGQFSCAIPLKHSPLEVKFGKIPVRWTAPEGFSGEFSPQSDIWSFGLTMWETVHYATTIPYAEETFAARAIINKEVPEKPKECPDKIFDEFIVPCWQPQPEDRPTASKLLVKVSNALGFWSREELDMAIPFPTDNKSSAEFNEELAKERKRKEQEELARRKSTIENK